VSRVWPLLVALSRDWLRNREAAFFALLFPVILLVIFSAVFAGGSAEFTLFVQNNDVEPGGEPTNLSSAFVESLKGVDALAVQSLDPDRNPTAWREGSRTTETQRLLVIPEGFGAAVRNRSLQVRMAVIADTTERMGGQLNASQTAQIRRNVQRARNATNATAPVTVAFRAPPDDESAPTVRGIVDSVVAGFNDRAIGVEEPTVAVESERVGGENLGATDYYLPAFIAAVVLINGVMTVPAVVAGFKHDGTLKRLAGTPLRRRDWILATILQQTVIALVMLGVMVVVARLLFGVTAVPGPLSVALVSLGAVAFTALGIVLAGFLPDPDAATSLGGAVAFPMMFLSGVFWELDVMPPAIRTVAEFMPLYHFHRGLRQLMVRGTTEGLFVPFAVLGVMAAVFVVLAVRTTRWRDF